MENTAMMVTAILNQVLAANSAVSSNKELKVKTRLVIENGIVENILFDNFIASVKPVYVNHPSWPTKKGGDKVGENAARKTAAGAAFNSLASLFRQLFTADENGMIREKTAAEKAPKKAEKTEDPTEELAPENADEMKLAAKLDELTIEQLAGMLLARCGNDKKAAKKAIDSVAK